MQNTHLCGSVYGNDSERCPYLLYPTKKDQKHGDKPLKQYSVYCTVDNRCRSLGNAGSFTGNSPTWCPKRKALAEGGQTP